MDREGDHYRAHDGRLYRRSCLCPTKRLAEIRRDAFARTYLKQEP